MASGIRPSLFPPLAENHARFGLITRKNEKFYLYQLKI